MAAKEPLVLKKPLKQLALIGAVLFIGAGADRATLDRRRSCRLVSGSEDDHEPPEIVGVKLTLASE
jgi:hypothetical protein